MTDWIFWYSSYKLFDRDWRCGRLPSYPQNFVENHLEAITDELSLTTGEMK